MSGQHTSFRVSVPGTGEAFDADDLESVLRSALVAGVKLPSDCRQGGCGTCRIRVLAGTVEYDEEPMALSAEEAAAGYALACLARPTSDLSIELASPALPEPARRIAVVRAVRPMTSDVAHLALEVPEGELDYLPGQYMKVHLGDGATKNFSMASPPAGAALDFHVRRIPGGRFTDGVLQRLRPGDRLDVEVPLGTFFLRRQDYRPLLMVATGTGLAPIKAILESLLDDPDCPPVTLYWGMRTAADLYLHEEIHAWRERLADFRYVPVLSRADDAWTGRRGHVQDAVTEDFDDLSGHAIYLCGSPAMIASAREVLRARGASMEHTYSDGFHFQHPGASGSSIHAGDLATA